MAYAAIEQLLKNTMGLNSASIGSSAIVRAVKQRMQKRQDQTPEEYLMRLRSSAAELESLIDLVVVPETWFFRDRTPFDALAKFARTQWPKLGCTGPLRVLSIPCSSGEEPYTIVMTLLDAGLAPADFQVTGVDISEPNLQRARAGLYRDHSFRGDDISFRDRYFLKSEQGYLLQPRVREQARLIQGNMLAPDFLFGEEPYHVVFCRNLLIYFDRETQGKALSVIERLLHRKGMLFLGHAEAGVLQGRDFASWNFPRSFAFVYGDKQRSTEVETVAAFKLPSPRRTLPRNKPAANPRPFADIPDTAAVADKPATTDLANATRLANEGHLVEAATFCEQYIRQAGPDAQAFYLIALLRLAVGEPVEAEAYLRKALYLDPAHYEALTQLALLLEQNGDVANAELMRQRAMRSFQRQTTEAAGNAGSS